MKLKLNGTVVSNDTAQIYRNWFSFTDICCPGDIQSALEQLPDGEILELEINSTGGSVYAGFEMYSMLRDSGREIRAEILGIAASAMSVVICAAQEVLISPVGNIMVHRASTCADGNSQDMSEAKQMLDTIDDSILEAYQQKTGQSEDTLREWMENETFFTAREAIEAGFADGMMFSETAGGPAGAVASIAELSGLWNPQNQKPVSEKGVGNRKDAKGREEGMEITSTEELRKQYGELVEEIEAKAGETERERINAIHALSMNGFEDLIENAVNDPKQNAGDVAMAIIARQKEQGKAYLEGVKDDARKGPNQVPDAPTPQDEEKNPADAAKEAVEMWKKNGGAF